VGEIVERKGAIRETGVPVEVVADYLLYTLNRFKR
jgi:hypothetical protein